MSHSEPSKLAASKPATTDQKAQNPPLFALAAAVVSDFIIVVFVPVSEKLCQSQAAQLSSTEHPSAYQQAQHLMLVTFVIIGFGVFDIVSLPKQVSQQKPA